MKKRFLVWFLFFCLIPFGFLLSFQSYLISLIVISIGLWGFFLGAIDYLQTRRAILRNYPLTARLRFFFESIRPEIRQYFVESDKEKVPFSREQRNLVYQRAKNLSGIKPFGSLEKMDAIGHEWLNHSIMPSHIKSHDFRVLVGKKQCKKPYLSSFLNISGMSFGALSPQAIESLNLGAKINNFAHTTGEGGVSSFHKKNKGDLIWQIGSGYFGCRDEFGNFDDDKFKEQAKLDQIKMIEIKLSQGAKPGHGGILPAAKVTSTIALARGVQEGIDCISPSSHSAFKNPIELINFINKLRDLSSGKPVGIKLCVGHPWEWFAIAKAIVKFKSGPDFITIDGSEGGSGAAPSEFMDHVGAPLQDGLMLVHNTLLALGIRKDITLIASGKLISGHDLARISSIGADICNMARGFMFALGCIQAQTCHNGMCPTGITTQDPSRARAIVIEEKHKRVANFHKGTLMALKEIVEAAGVKHPDDFRPEHLVIRAEGNELGTASSIFTWLKEGDLNKKMIDHPAFSRFWKKSSYKTFNIM